MSDLFPHPEALSRAEYVRLSFHLQLREYFDLPPLALLRLRRELQQALKVMAQGGAGEPVRQLRRLFEPPLSLDPALRRLTQKPAPAFVLQPQLERQGLVEPGDWLELSVLFLGEGLAAIEPFCLLLQGLGEQGLYSGQGCFELACIEAEDGAGRRSTLWNGGRLSGRLLPPVNDLGWWLSCRPPLGEGVRLEFLSPARLLRQGRPLFRAGFRELFPFVLRRVTSMLAVHCRIEPVADPEPLLQAAGQVVESGNLLQWRDWKQLDDGRRGQELGGLCGTLECRGEGLADLAWLLQLGSLLQLGKGAAYGAGRYRLDPF